MKNEQFIAKIDKNWGKIFRKNVLDIRWNSTKSSS